MDLCVWCVCVWCMGHVGAVQEIVGLGGVDFNLRVLGILIFHTVKKGERKEKKIVFCVIFVFSSYFFLIKKKNGIGFSC